jgi:hypothetical protein
MKPNTTGLPDVGSYNLGRGKVYKAVIDTVTGKPNTDGFLFLGNCPQFNLNVTEETLEHVSSQEGTGTVDKQVTTKRTASINFQLDEINQETMRMFFSGTTTTETNSAVAGFAEINQKYMNVKLGRWYELSNSTGVRAFDIQLTTDVVLEKDAAMDVPLVEGTDYELDYVWGRFRLLSTAVNIATGDEINLTVVANAACQATWDVMRAFQQSAQAEQLLFQRINPANNDEEGLVYIRQTTVKADGDLALVGEDWTVCGFTGVLEANNTGYANSPYLDVITHADS